MKELLTATAMISLTGLAVALLAAAVNFDNLPVGIVRRVLTSRSANRSVVR
jgi:hypothetical protein